MECMFCQEKEREKIQTFEFLGNERNVCNLCLIKLRYANSKRIEELGFDVSDCPNEVLFAILHELGYNEELRQQRLKERMNRRIKRKSIIIKHIKKRKIPKKQKKFIPMVLIKI